MGSFYCPKCKLDPMTCKCQCDDEKEIEQIVFDPDFELDYDDTQD